MYRYQRYRPLEGKYSFYPLSTGPPIVHPVLKNKKKKLGNIFIN